MKQNRQYQVVNRSNNKPIHRKTHHQQRTKTVVPNQFFQGNLVQNMRFGGKDHNLSGYVQRTVVIKNRHGDIQIAKEKQFFNSSKNGMRIMVDRNDKDE